MKNDLALYNSLLAGNFIKKRQGNKHPYAVYDAKNNPLLNVSQAFYKKIYPFIKKDKKGRITLNLSSVRQLHGNELLKKLYKKTKQKN